MFNPQQNININISYNLGNQKPSKSITGKKNTKNQKANYSHSTANCDIQIKLKNKPVQGARKASDNKQTGDKKGLKKKQVQIGRNTFTPDLFNQRRMKTEGPSAELDNSSTIKKQSKSKNVSKSTQPAQQKTGGSMKRSGTAKTTKSLKAGHVNSFSLLNWKKNPLELGEHILSQAITTLPKKRKTISQLVNNDKVVTKLLNVSLLASDIGGSRPITSDRGYSSSSSKTFKEYLSSIDMRILRVMQDDVPIFSKRENSNQEVIKSILREKSISLEDLTRKAVVIQRAWKKMMKKIIVNKYKLLFQQATGKLIKQQKEKQKEKQSKQLSNYAAQSIHSQTFNIQDLVKDQLGSAVSFNRQGNVGQVILGGNSIKNYQISWIEESQAGFKSSSQVLNGPLSNFQQHNPSWSKEKRAQHWNSINKKLSNLMNNKKQFDPTLLLDDFIEQSNYNKQWIENQFQPSSKKKSLLNSQQKVQNQFSSQNSCQEGTISQCYLKKQIKQISEGDEDSLQEQLSQYNRRKYVNQSDKNSRNLQLVRNIIKTDLDDNFHQSSEPAGLSHYILQDKVVKNYLDCGLDDFGLQISKKILSPDQIDDSYDNSEDFQNTKNAQEQFFIDQQIGKKFQQANRGLIRLNQVQKDEIQPKIGLKLDNKQLDRLIDENLDNLISQFALDISHILKKSVPPPPPPPQKIVYNPNRPIGIQSNFNSVKTYVTKLLAYVEKEQINIKKIIENINKDIGPSSLQILTYLRPQYEDGSLPNMQQQSQQLQEQGLFVIPAELFQRFQTELEEQYKILNHKQMAPRIKAYLNFWNRCIFEALNEYLDHERPYGIDGKPYDWVTQAKIFRIVNSNNLKKRIESGYNRLYDNIQFVGGIIFEKSDSPFGSAPISDEQKHQINEERLSRILATELLQTQSSWINYNDESAELLVELSRLIQDKIFFEYITEMKKMQRRRRMIIEDFNEEQHIFYNL